MDNIQRALIFASEAHTGQLRRYTNTPYIIHPITVAHTITNLPEATEEMVMAALLHDVVEDTKVTDWDVSQEFGGIVAYYVRELTDFSVRMDFKGPREKRKALDRQMIGESCEEVHTIKLADLIHNSESIMAHDPRFACTYMKEKKALLEVLTKGNKELHLQATNIVSNYYKLRNNK